MNLKVIRRLLPLQNRFLSLIHYNNHPNYNHNNNSTSSFFPTKLHIIPVEFHRKFNTTSTVEDASTSNTSKTFFSSPTSEINYNNRYEMIYMHLFCSHLYIYLYIKKIPSSDTYVRLTIGL